MGHLTDSLGLYNDEFAAIIAANSVKSKPSACLGLNLIHFAALNAAKWSTSKPHPVGTSGTLINQLRDQNFPAINTQMALEFGFGILPIPDDDSDDFCRKKLEP